MNTDLFAFVMNYGRFEDDDASKDTVRVLISAAAVYLSNAGIPVDEDDELYRLALAGLVLHWFDHRDAVAGEAELPTNLRPLINQLKLRHGAVV